MQGKIRHMCRPRGQALVEFALIVPILMLILVGIADTGLLISTNQHGGLRRSEGSRLLESNGANSAPVATCTLYGPDCDNRAQGQ